jgi:hypothetical protein
MIDESLSRGIIAFIGQPGRLDRVSPEERVLRACPEDGLDLLPRIKAILDEMGEHDPPLLGWTVQETGDRAEMYVRDHHPEVSNEAIKAIGNSTHSAGSNSKTRHTCDLPPRADCGKSVRHLRIAMVLVWVTWLWWCWPGCQAPGRPRSLGG